MSAETRARPDWVFNLHDDAQGIRRKLAEGIVSPPREEYRKAGGGFGPRA